VRLKGNRMRKYYKLTEAGTYVKPWTNSWTEDFTRTMQPSES
jgi:hypothetical protein